MTQRYGQRHTGKSEQLIADVGKQNAHSWCNSSLSQLMCDTLTC